LTNNPRFVASIVRHRPRLLDQPPPFVS